MRVPLSWLREYVDLPTDLDAHDLADRLTALGLKLEALEQPGSDITGPLVVGRVVDFESERHSNGKTVRWCSVDVGEPDPRGIVCGAANFAAGDLVAVALPGSQLPGGFAISARRTYGHVSDGMICSARELGIGEDASGILVLAPGELRPGDDAAAALGLRDAVLEFEITPDRAYALSLRGVAREAAAAYGLPFADPADRLPPAHAGKGYPVTVTDPADCDAFVALEVEGVDAKASSPRWLSRRLELAGIRSLSLAVDVTNYVMLELGSPIHGYDRDRLRGPIVVRRAQAGEKLTTLDGVARTLDAEDLLITDDRGPIGLAGVMGGAETEISPDTTAVVVEAARFDPVAIARTARRHRLPSEASKRFERGIDPTLAAVAARRVADLLVELGGGHVAATATVTGQPAPATAIRLPAQLPSRLAGLAIPPATTQAALDTVGCTVRADDTDLSVTPPPWRPDLTDPHDLVEEVLRIVGYDMVPSVLPLAPAGRGLTKTQRLRRRVARALAAAGYVEVVLVPFVGDGDLDSLDLPEGDGRRAALRIANPLSDEEPLLRTTLLPGLLRAAARNRGRSLTDLALYELGAVFLPGVAGRPPAPRLGVDRAPTEDERKELDAALPDQPWHVGAVICGNRGARGWWGDARPGSWADAVELGREVGRALGVTVTVSPDSAPPWHPGRCARLSVGSLVVGYAGELHPRVCGAYGVPVRTSAAELDLDALLAHAPDLVRGPALSTYPVAKEDVALVVDESVPAGEVVDALRDGAGELLEEISLFDVYRGEQVGVGRKSLAFSMRLRAPDRTLTDGEIKAVREAAVEEAQRRTGARLRS